MMIFKLVIVIMTLIYTVYNCTIFFFSIKKARKWSVMYIAPPKLLIFDFVGLFLIGGGGYSVRRENEMIYIISLCLFVVIFIHIISKRFILISKEGIVLFNCFFSNDDQKLAHIEKKLKRIAIYYIKNNRNSVYVCIGERPLNNFKCTGKLYC